MNIARRIRPLLLALYVAVFASCAAAQPQPKSQEFEPKVGQQGKDVVWVPTPQELVEKMLDIAKVTPKDYVIDLGSGDGRTVIAAAKRGARAMGTKLIVCELTLRNGSVVWDLNGRAAQDWKTFYAAKPSGGRSTCRSASPAVRSQAEPGTQQR